MKSFEVMSMVAQKDEAALTSECLIPLLILETFAKSDRPMSVADIGKSLDIDAAIQQPHFEALEDHEFIQSSGSQSTFEFGRRLVVLCAALATGDLT